MPQAQNCSKHTVVVSVTEPQILHAHTSHTFYRSLLISSVFLFFFFFCLFQLVYGEPPCSSPNTNSFCLFSLCSPLQPKKWIRTTWCRKPSWQSRLSATTTWRLPWSPWRSRAWSWATRSVTCSLSPTRTWYGIHLMAFVCLFPPFKSADAWDITPQLAPDLVQFALDSIFF